MSFASLSGTITSLTPDGTCVFQFANLTTEDRRALRVEIRGGHGHRAAKPAAPAKSTGKAPVSNLSINLTSASVSLTANQW